jgi:RNA polymerase sigma-70 factor (ECF subfamily)
MAVPPDLALFCEEQHPRLVGMLGLYCGDRFIAEELAQEALMKACRDWRRVRSKDDPAAWIRRVGFNLTHSYFRRKLAERRARERLASQTVSEAEPDPALAVSLRHAIAALSRRQRTAIILHYYLDLPFPAVADFMDIPLSTAKSAASRGIARLRASSDLFELKEARDAS